VLYIDTSVLLVYTLTQALEPARYTSTRKLVAKIATGKLAAATSFYALHEVYLFALGNAPDFPTGAAFGKGALNRILRLPLQIFPLVSREERRLLGRKLSALPDASDMPHAVAALLHGCEAIVAYDEHFRAITEVIGYKTPADCV
jgi:predicted nucleic acid-binding protein